MYKELGPYRQKREAWEVFFWRLGKSEVASGCSKPWFLVVCFFGAATMLAACIKARRLAPGRTRLRVFVHPCLLVGSVPRMCS